MRRRAPTPKLSTRTPDPGNAGGGSSSPTCSLISVIFHPRREQHMRHLFVLPVLLALLCATYAGAEAAAEKPAVLTVMGHDSMVVPEEVLAEFEERYGARGQHSAGRRRRIGAQPGHPGRGQPARRRAVRRRQRVPEPRPRGRRVRALRPAALADIAPELRLDASGHATPIDFGDVCVNYDITWFDDAGLEPPQTLEDLADPAYVDLLVVENPASSSPGSHSCWPPSAGSAIPATWTTGARCRTTACAWPPTGRPPTSPSSAAAPAAATALSWCPTAPVRRSR